jgi:hypothetical protein
VSLGSRVKLEDVPKFLLIVRNVSKLNICDEFIGSSVCCPAIHKDHSKLTADFLSGAAKGAFEVNVEDV